MLSIHACQLFNLTVIVSLLCTGWLGGGPSPGQVAPWPKLGLSATTGGVQSPDLSQTDRASNASGLPLVAPVGSGGLAQASMLTGTLVFTTTEDFTSRDRQDAAKTTADWNISDGMLTLPPLPDASGQSLPSLAVDAAGNTYVVWQDMRNGPGDPDIYAQKFDADGRRLWPADVRVNTDSSPAEQLSSAVVLDAADNPLVVWDDRRNGTESIYAQKLDPNGNKLWGTDKRVNGGLADTYPRGDPAAALDPTTGDIIVVWDDVHNYWDIYAQRLKADGNRAWSVDVRVNKNSTASQYDPAVGVNSDGNIYVAWTDTRNDDGCPTCPFPDTDIYAQKLNPSGSVQWPVDKRVTNEAVYTGGMGFGYSVMAIDSTDNIYIAWKHTPCTVYAQKLGAEGNQLWPDYVHVNDCIGFVDYPAIALGSDETVFVAWSFGLDTYNRDVYAQKLDTDTGARMWQNEVRVNSAIPPTYSRSVAASSTSGDIRIAWEDQRHGQGDVYMQRLDLAGTKLWPLDVRANTDPGTATQAPAIVVDAAGDSYIAWGDGRNASPYLNVYSQKLNTTGNLMWPHNLRINVKDSDIYYTAPSIATDMAGTLAIAWDDGQDIYARELGTDGIPLWPTELQVNSDAGTAVQFAPFVALDKSANIYTAWTDYRNHPYLYSDIYIQKLDPDRSKVWPEDRLVHQGDAITTTQTHSTLVFDDHDNSLYVVWQDNSRTPSGIYAQRLDLDGNPQWAEDPWLNSGAEPVVAAANGYAYVAWKKSLDTYTSEVYVQKIASDGSKAWPDDVLLGPGFSPAIAAGDSGDSYVAWWGWNNGDADIFAQKLGGNGAKLWTLPVKVNSDGGWVYQQNPSLGLDAAGNAYVVWEDYRRSRPDIYAQKLLPDGSKAWAGDVRVNPEQLYLAEAEARSQAVDSTSDNIPWATLTAGATLPTGSAISYYLSNNGGATWVEVAPGIPHTFGTAGNDLRWRATLVASPDQTRTPVIDWLQIKYSTIAPPNSVRVRDENLQPVPGARIYRNGQFAGLADDEGGFIFSELQTGDYLVALQHVYEQPTIRTAHDPDGSGNFAYRVYRTSMSISNSGELEPYVVPGNDQSHSLVISSTNTLVLFNMVVSIEWDATGVYLAEIANAIQSASDYLYDLSDGQMAFGQVAIYDDGQKWSEADLQILTHNIVRPHADVGGLTSGNKSHVIRVGRFWDGNSGNQGAWDQPDGYRTLAHEFGHYGLYLYDEYFAYTFGQNGNLTGMEDSYCTGPENRNPATEATNASAMDYQYTTSELSARGVPGMWSSRCEHTAQWQLNPTADIFTDPGESAWETVARKYADAANPSRWRLTTPADRGHVLAEPHDLPDNYLALPAITITNGGTSGEPRHLMIYGQDGLGFWGAIVALYKQSGRVIGQGFTNGNGRLDIYGADEGDTIRASSISAGLAGSASVGPGESLSLTLAPVGRPAAQTTGGIPHLRVVAEPSLDPGQTDLLVFLHDFGPGADPHVTVTKPSSEAGLAPILSYSPATDTYQGQISFSVTEQGTGRIRAVGELGNSLIRLQTTYRLQRVVNDPDQGQVVYSNDGNLSLHLKPGSLPGNDAYLVVMPPGAVPGHLPAGQVLVGDAYDVTASGALMELGRPAILKLRYDGALVNPKLTPEGLAIYHWNESNREWEEISGGSLDEEQKAMVASVTTLGTYALLAPPGEWTEPLQESIFLPIIIKDVR